MNRIRLTRMGGLIAPIALVAFLAFFGSRSIQAAPSPTDIGCQSVIESGTNTSYMGCSFAGTRDSAENTARAFLAANADTLNFDSGSVADMSVIEVKHGLASTHTRFEQVFQGHPVFGSGLTVNQGPDGNVQSLHSSYASGLTAIGSANRSALDAEALAIEAAEAIGLRHASPTRLVWFPQKGQAILAWEITVFSSNPLGDFLTVVDATSGDILFQENRIAFDDGTGLTYVPNPFQTQGSDTNMDDNNDATNATLDSERISVTLQNLDAGTGLLVGTWVDLTLAGGKAVPDADEATRNYAYDRDDDRFEQVVVYHSVDRIAQWFHDLGFDDDTGTPNGIRDFPSLAHAHWDDADNSFYSTGDDAIHFGDGGVDDAEDADIVAHEYGHAVQHNQNANWGGGEMGAMGEAFGDYLAASFYFNDGDAAFQAANAACVGEWDATSYSNTTPPCLRRVDGTKMYPGDLVGQVHADGEIWSRALWDIHNTIGRDTTMQIVLEHHFALPASSDMPTAALAMIQADANLNGPRGGTNDAVIRGAFCDRGILVQPNCSPQAVLAINSIVWSDALGNNNGFVDPGEPIQLTVELVNSGTSTATNIAMTMTNPNGGATMDTDMSAYPDIAAAATAANTTTFALTVNEDNCGDRIQLAFAGTYDNGVDTGIAMNGQHTLQIGEFNGSTTNHAFAGSIAIPDNTAAGVSQSITVTPTDVLGDLNLNVSADHTWVGDLIVTLEHVNSGTTVTAIDRPGVPDSINGCSENDVDVTLDDEATAPVENACEVTPPALGGSLMPNEALSAFDGIDPSGDWTLNISDNVGFDTGTLTGFSLDITSGEFVCEPVDNTVVTALNTVASTPSRVAPAVAVMLLVLMSVGIVITNRRKS